MATKKQADGKLKEEIKENAGKVWLAGLGALATAEEEGGKLFRGLVKKGQSFEKQGLAQFDKLKAKVEEVAEAAKDRAGEAWGKVEEKVEGVEERLDDRVAGVLRKIGVPSKNEIANLTRRVEELTDLVEKKLKSASPKSPKSTTAKRPATKSAGTKSATAKRKPTTTRRTR